MKSAPQQLLRLAAVLAVAASFVAAFTVPVLRQTPVQRRCANTHTRLFESNTDAAAAASLPDIATMKAREMKAELESYDVSTKSLFEKSEFEQALRKARAEGKKPKTNGTSASSANGASSSSSSPNDGKTRQQRYDEAFAAASAMKVGDIKKELQSRGVSTKSFFEKSEFVKAYAEAVADNKSGGTQREAYDPTYRDVAVSKFDPRSLLGQRVIDVR